MLGVEYVIETWRKGGIKRVLLAVIVFMILGFIITLTTDLAHSLYNRSVEKLHRISISNKSNKNSFTEVIMIQNEPLHVGNNDKPDYPVQKDAGLNQYTYEVVFKQRPRKVTLSIEVYDMDTIGGKVFFNDFEIGSFSVGDPWHVDTFKIKSDYLKKGRNTITIKTNILKTGKMEDFLFRNLKLFVEY